LLWWQWGAITDVDELVVTVTILLVGGLDIIREEDVEFLEAEELDGGLVVVEFDDFKIDELDGVWDVVGGGLEVVEFDDLKIDEPDRV
jgi:hypothetical protein